MMKRFFSLLVFIYVATAVFAGEKGNKQDITDHEMKLKIKKAEALLADHSYYNAAVLLKEVADTLTEHEYINYLTGRVFFTARDYQTAEIYLKRVAEMQEKDARYPMALFMYAETLQMNQKYNDAKLYFLKFGRLKNNDKETKLYKTFSRKLAASCDWAMKQVQYDSANVRIDTLPGDVNHGYSEFSPLPIAKDELVFASLRSDTVITYSRDENKIFSVKLYKSYFEEGAWSQPQEMPKINHQYEHTANATITPDGKLMYFSRCYQDAHNKIICHLYQSQKEGNTWGKPHKIHGKINQHGYTSTQPTLGVAYKKKKKETIAITTLYFVSDRPGGKGGLDIWYSTMDDKGNFGAPLNCGRINTVRDEVSPYYDQDSATLYFSSNYHTGFGGQDIFKTIGNTKSWRSIENLLLPVNSSYDDTYYVIDQLTRGKTDAGFLVSNRPGGKVLTSETCCDDIYSFAWEEPIYRPLEGTIYAEVVKLVEDTMQYVSNVDSLAITKEVNKSKLSNVKIGAVRKRHVEDPNTNDYAAFSDFITWIDTTKTGDFSIQLENSKDYVLVLEHEKYGTKLISLTPEQSTIEAKFEKTDSALVKKKLKEIQSLSLNVNKEDLVKDAKFILDNVYFDSGNDKFREESEASLVVLLTFLEDNPKVNIEISGHTDDVGDDASNQKLSERRAKNVRQYLIENGIKENRLTYVGYGESQPIADNKTSAGRKKNRRTEVKIL